MDWIRVDGNLPGHPKVTRLAELLCVPQATAVGYVVMLWCWAVQYAPEGGPVTAAVCSVCVRGGHGDKRVTRRVARLYDAFLESGVIDPDGMLHDWHVYQGAIVEKRERDREHARKSRDRRASVARSSAGNRATVATHETRRDVRDETRRDVVPPLDDDDETVVVVPPQAGGTAATTISDKPEFPPDDPEPEDFPPNPDPEAIPEPEANANPWHPDDEEAFGRRDKPHPRWQDYIEVHMAIKAPAPWPRFWDWVDQDSKRRANAPPVRIFQRVTNPVHEEGPLDGAGGAHAKAG